MSIISAALIIFGTFYCISVLYLYSGLFHLRCPDNKHIHTFSVVIAVHNEEKSLQKCFDAVISQNYPSDKYEIILADDRSTDTTPAIINRLCQNHPNVRSVRIEPHEKAVPKKTALARAFELATGEIILTTDGDCLPSDSWISSINENFTAKVGLVVGHVDYFKPENLWAGIDALDYLSHRALGASFLGVNSLYTCTAANMAFRKEIFTLNRDRFNALSVSPAEDNFFLHCAKNGGLKIVQATGLESIVK
ncbi:MAG: glycosyltransferase, partial [Fibrobacter sp.]|nr:glycosyltransferase [Fibrobacter sp.]